MSDPRCLANQYIGLAGKRGSNWWTVWIGGAGKNKIPEALLQEAAASNPGALSGDRTQGPPAHASTRSAFPTMRARAVTALSWSTARAHDKNLAGNPHPGQRPLQTDTRSVQAADILFLFDNHMRKVLETCKAGRLPRFQASQPRFELESATRSGCAGR